MARPAQVFIAFSYRDQEQFDELSLHLSPLRRQGLISGWVERRIDKEDPQNRIQPEIRDSELILLLVTPGLIGTSYCYGEEFKEAQARHAQGKAQLVPVLVRPVDLAEAPFAGMRYLPSDGKPVSQWRDSDAAWLDVVQGLKQVLNSVAPREPPKGPAPSSANPTDPLRSSLTTQGTEHALTRSRIRQMLDDVLRLDSDLEAFCLDFFPKVRMRFSGGMERTAKVNILLLYAEPEGILTALRHHDGEAVSRALTKRS